MVERLVTSEIYLANRRGDCVRRTGTSKVLPLFQQRLTVGLLALAAFTGCTGGGLPGPTGTVEGQVTFQGQPCPQGTIVTFYHTKTGIIARGLTDAKGEFQLSMRDGRRVLVGDYEVSISPPAEDAATSRAIESGQPLTEEQKKWVGRQWKEIPAHYRLPATSGERFAVAEGKNTYTLDMQPAGPARSK